MIIGVNGFARAGKDSIANILVEKYGYERRAFADIMRTALYRLNPVVGIRPADVFVVEDSSVQDVVDNLGWDKAKVEYPEIRRLLQVLGTEVGRSLFGESFWVDQVTKDLDKDSLVVFSDVRFKNEAQKIKDLGGQVWRVERPGVKAANSHVSEHDLDGWKFDRIIYNSGEIRHLEEMVDRLLRPWEMSLEPGVQVLPDRSEEYRNLDHPKRGLYINSIGEDADAQYEAPAPGSVHVGGLIFAPSSGWVQDELPLDAN